MTSPLSAAQLQEHPEYEHVLPDLKPTQFGAVTVARDRGGPFQIAYELHGYGPRRIVLITGLGSLKTGWHRQTEDFGHIRASENTVLVFDNRGIGSSSKPMMRYSTSGMARDVLEVLEHLDWTSQPGSYHVVGISMGGMIAQELALLMPEATPIASLTLVSSAARIVNTVGFVQNVRDRIDLLVPKSIDRQLANTKRMVCTEAFISSPDDVACKVQPFPTAGDRFAALDLWKRSHPDIFTRTGFLCQLVAAGWHYKSADQLQDLADRIGRHNICVVHGTEDRMITFPHGQTLVEELSRGASDCKGVRAVMWEGQSHYIPIEKRAEFQQLLEEIMHDAARAD